MHVDISKLEVLITFNRLIGFSKQVNSVMWKEGWTLSCTWDLCFGFFFFFPLSIFLFHFCYKNTFFLKLWVVNLIILAWLLFFAPPMGCILLTCFLKSFLSIPASFATADITLTCHPHLFHHSWAFGDP